MRTFSRVLTEDRTVEDGRARLLHKLAEQQTASTRQTDTGRPRTLAAIAEVLRIRVALASAIPPHGAGS
jgi:hypothetical protein